MSTAIKGKAIIIHGGGLVDPSKVVLLRIAKTLWEKKVYDEIFIGKYSFESLYTKEFWEPYLSRDTEDCFKFNRGTYFGTCRGIDLTDATLENKAIRCLQENRITTVIVAGGDGSSRQVAEIWKRFKEVGINIIFAIPLTIDGINGGPSIGIIEAVKESVRQIENIVSTSLQTRDKGAFGVVMVELQGRNRDDIMGHVLKEFYKKKTIADEELDKILLRVVPANYETNEEKLIAEINKSSDKTLVLVSEGAESKIPELTDKIDRKVRSLVVGHPSQSNQQTATDDINEYNKWIDAACDHIKENPLETYSLVKFENLVWEVEIDYYAQFNPRSNQEAKLPEFLEYLIKMFMAKN